MAVYPSCTKSVANFRSAIERFFNLKPNYSCLRKIEQLLKEEEYENIIILNYDGLSTKLLSNLDSSNILVKNLVYEVTSAPYLFDSNVKNSSVQFFDEIIDKVNISCEYKAYGVFPYGLGAYKSSLEAYDRIINLSSSNNKKIICVAFNELLDLDSSNSLEIKDKLNDISNNVLNLVDLLENSLIFVVSSFGKAKRKQINLEDYYEIYDLIECSEYISSSSCLVKLKNNCLDNFRTMVADIFDNRLVVLTKDEAIEKHLLRMDSEFVGDCLLVVAGDLEFPSKDFGISLSKNELRVPIIAIKKKPYREIVRRAKEEDYEIISGAMRCVQKSRFKLRRDLFLSFGGIGRVEFLSLCDRTISNNCFVYDINGEVAGFIITKIEPVNTNEYYVDHDYFSIKFIYVFDKYRRQGIGTKLYKEAFRYAKKLHFSRIEISLWYFDEDLEKFILHLEPNLLKKKYEFYI